MHNRCGRKLNAFNKTGLFVMYAKVQANFNEKVRNVSHLFGRIK